MDRTVWDRRRWNWHERHVAGAAADLPAGYDLVDCEVGVNQRFYLFADDISDMYLCFVAPPARAITNGIAIELTPDERKGLKEVRRLEELYYSENTKKTRSVQIRRYENFCKDFGFICYPLVMRKYVAHLNKELVYSSIQQYISAVIVHVKILGFPVETRESFGLLWIL